MDPESHIEARVAAVVAPGSAICVGLSGGMDSIVLLDALVRAGPARGHSVAALHVHHGLSPNADAWAALCERACAERGVALDVRRVRVARDAPEGLEAAARAARYAEYAKRPEPILALAHHRDDQAETLLLQLLRGTGVKGAAGMPELRSLGPGGPALFRPLLDLPREAIAKYARERGLQWVEDESNASSAHDRNYLRHEIAPLLDERFAGWRPALTRFALHAATAQALLEELARIDGAPLCPGEGLALDAALDPARRANALRTFLAAEGLPMPTQARLEEIARQLYEARGDARIRIAHGGALLVRGRGVARVEHGEPAQAHAQPWRVEWKGEPLLDLGPGRGLVRFTPQRGAGLRAFSGEAWYFAPRSGGERLRLETARHSRTVKNLLREAEVPEWRRDALPLLFQGDRLAWVPELGVAAEFACAPGESGLVPDWRPQAPASTSG